MDQIVGKTIVIVDQKQHLTNFVLWRVFGTGGLPHRHCMIEIHMFRLGRQRQEARQAGFGQMRQD